MTIHKNLNLNTKIQPTTGNLEERKPQNYIFECFASKKSKLLEFYLLLKIVQSRPGCFISFYQTEQLTFTGPKGQSISLFCNLVSQIP